MARPAQTSKKRIRILIADREGVYRLGLKKLFAVEDNLRVVAQAEDGAQALGLAQKFKPDVLFVQAEILAEESADFLERVRQASSGGKILITASILPEDEALRYVRAGASGAIQKSAEPSLFVKSVNRIMDNEIWLPKRQVGQMAKLLAEAADRPLRPADTLTHREKTVISYLLQGWRNRQIARHLRISEQTVKNHLRTIYDKVGVSDRLELVLYAIHQRLELPPVRTVATPA